MRMARWEGKGSVRIVYVCFAQRVRRVWDLPSLRANISTSARPFLSCPVLHSSYPPNIPLLQPLHTKVLKHLASPFYDETNR